MRFMLSGWLFRAANSPFKVEVEGAWAESLFELLFSSLTMVTITAQIPPEPGVEKAKAALERNAAAKTTNNEKIIFTLVP